LSHFITAPSLDIINEKAFTFYSKAIGAHIPKFILRDLSRSQALDRLRNAPSIPNNESDEMDIDSIVAQPEEPILINEEIVEEDDSDSFLLRTSKKSRTS